MNLQLDMDWPEAAVRFTSYTEGVCSCIIGSSSIKNIRQNFMMLEKGKLPDELYQKIRNSFRENDDNWVGQV